MKRKYKKHTLTDRGASVLARQIIVSAINDYLELNRWLERNPIDNGTDYWNSRFNNLLDVRVFFYGDWFRELTGNHINPVWVIEKMDQIVLLKGKEYYKGKDILIQKIRSLMNDLWKI